MINLKNPAFPDLNNYCNTDLYIATALQTHKQANKTTVHIYFIHVGLFGCHLLSQVDIYSLYYEVYFTIALLVCIRYNEDFVKSTFFKSRSCSIHFTVILAGLKKTVCYTEDFVLQRFVKSRFHCRCVGGGLSIVSFTRSIVEAWNLVLFNCQVCGRLLMALVHWPTEIKLLVLGIFSPEKRNSPKYFWISSSSWAG